MKKLFFAVMTMLTISISANAMSYEQARNEALFLTDKMAYELNLTDEQYEAAYEINLDYLMGVTGREDVFGTYWERRNLDLSYILLDWQWNSFIAATYFYRPLYWEAGYWHFGIYRHYPRRDYFFFGRPHFYATYRGGHAWHVYGGRGYYHGHSNFYRVPSRAHFSMHDRWTRGDFRGSRNSSTRITGHSGYDRSALPLGSSKNRRIGDRSGSGNFRGYRGSGRSALTHGSSKNFGGGRSGNFSGSQSGSSFSGARSSSGSFSGSRSSSSFGSTRGGGSFSSGGSHSGSFGGGSHGGGSFGGGSHGSGHGHGGGLGGRR